MIKSLLYLLAIGLLTAPISARPEPIELFFSEYIEGTTETFTSSPNPRPMRRSSRKLTS